MECSEINQIFNQMGAQKTLQVMEF